MSATLLRRTQHFFILLGGLFVLLAFAAYRTSSEHVASVAQTLQKDAFIQDLDELLATIADAETGQRGYLLTGDPEYLRPFTRADSVVSRNLEIVENMSANNEVRPQDVQALRDAVRAKMAELHKTIDLQEGGKPQAALAEVKTDVGLRLMTEVRQIIARIKAKQAAAFQRSLEQQRRRQLELDLVLAGGVAIAFLLLFFSFRFSRLYERERDAVELEIRALNNSLEARVQERTAELEARGAELEARSAELSRSNADLMQFAYIASHDLQEPLRMVGSYMGLLARRYEGQLDESAQKYIHFAIDGATRMQALIEDLLNYSRVGTQKLDKKRFSSEVIVQRALANLELAIRESGAVIQVGSLPEIYADELKMTQVVQNLVGNAIKFRKPQIAPDIKIGATREGGEWLFSVADNGIGFDAKYCDRIFHVFQRLHSRGRYPGNGIGLAICRRIVEHHGGKLWATSAVDQGSTFFFTLPVIKSAGSKDRTGTAEVGVPKNETANVGN